MFLLAAVVGFYLLLRWKSVRPLERLILEALSGPSDGREKPAFAVVDVDCLGVGDRHRGMAILEWIEPFYFVQDDNFAERAAAILQRLPLDLPAENFPTSIPVN